MKRFSFFVAFAALLLLGRLTLHVQTAQAQTTPPPNVIITLTGDNFTRQSTVFIGTAQFTPEYVSPNTLRVSIPRSLLSSAQPNNVRVVNPSAGGGSSAALPLVVACRANNAVFADVSIVATTYSFHQLDSARYATPEFSSTPISADMRQMLAIKNRPYIKKSSMTGKVFNDGNAEIRFEDLESNEPSSLPLQDQIRYSIMKTATDSIEVYTGTNELLFKLPVGSKPFKPIVDKIYAIRDAIFNQSQTTQAQRTTSSSAAPGTIFPSDSVIARTTILYEAWKMGFPVQRVGNSHYYRITLRDSVMIPNDILASVKLAPSEEIHIFLNTATDVVEEIRTFRGTQIPKPLVHRTIQNYSFDANNKIIWKSKVSYSYYEYEGIPMVFGNADVFEQFKVTLIE
mgnify:CR=1 FL=1